MYVQCENIAFACDRDTKVTINDVIIEDNFENEVPRASQVNKANGFRSDVCRSDESNNESFHFDVFQSDDKEVEFCRSDVCRIDDSNDVGFRFDVFQSDDKEVEFCRSDVCRSDDSNDLGFRFDVPQSDDIEIEFSCSDACRSDGRKNVNFRLDIDSDDTEVFDACREDQEFLVDSGQKSKTSTSRSVRTNEADVLPSDNLKHVGIGLYRDRHNLCNTDCSDHDSQYCIYSRRRHYR